MISDPIRLAIAPASVWQNMAPPDGGSILMDDAAMPIQGHVTFDEALRALNPLHHIPVVGTIYRMVSGEEIQPAFRVLGGLVTGGPVGAITAALTSFVEMTQPFQRMQAVWNGLPDPGMASPREPYRLATNQADALAAYRRWTAEPPENTAVV